jgi:hypothetical protein
MHTLQSFNDTTEKATQELIREIGNKFETIAEFIDCLAGADLTGISDGKDVGYIGFKEDQRMASDTLVQHCVGSWIYKDGRFLKLIGGGQRYLEFKTNRKSRAVLLLSPDVPAQELECFSVCVHLGKEPSAIECSPEEILTIM